MKEMRNATAIKALGNMTLNERREGHASKIGRERGTAKIGREGHASKIGREGGMAKIGREGIITRRTCLCWAALLLALCLCGSFFACADSEGEQKTEKYFFSVGGLLFSVGDELDGVTRALGEPQKRQIASSCAGVGSDEVAVYSGFRIYAHREGATAVITAIELTNDTVLTAEGVCIGDGAEKLTEIYGEGKHFSGGVEYAGANCKLRVYIKNDKVIGIRYEAE